MSTTRTEPACTPVTPRSLLPQYLVDTLRQTFSPRQVGYIAQVLTAGELSVISDLKDALFIARIKRMSASRLELYDRFVPKDKETLRLYQAVQARWLRDEEYLLGTRLGRSPTHRELFIDFMNNHNGLRFRAYFTMKFPKRMRKCPAHAPASN